MFTREDFPVLPFVTRGLFAKTIACFTGRKGRFRVTIFRVMMVSMYRTPLLAREVPPPSIVISHGLGQTITSRATITFAVHCKEIKIFIRITFYPEADIWIVMKDMSTLVC